MTTKWWSAPLKTFPLKSINSRIDTPANKYSYLCSLYSHDYVRLLDEFVISKCVSLVVCLGLKFWMNYIPIFVLTVNIYNFMLEQNDFLTKGLLANCTTVMMMPTVQLQEYVSDPMSGMAGYLLFKIQRFNWRPGLFYVDCFGVLIIKIAHCFRQLFSISFFA